MKKILALFALILLTACAANPLTPQQAASITFSEFRVSTKNADFKNDFAKARRARVANDLKYTLMEKFDDRLSEDGHIMSVNIGIFDMHSTGALLFGFQTNQLHAIVDLINPKTNATVATYQLFGLSKLTMDAKDQCAKCSTDPHEGKESADGAEGYYRNLVADFAKTTRFRITAQ